MPRRKNRTGADAIGIRDTEQGSPAHDALMADFVHQNIIQHPVEMLHPRCVFFSSWSYQYALEVPITHHERIIGFADMVVTATRRPHCHLYAGYGRADRRTAARRNGRYPAAYDEPEECCQDAYWYLRTPRDDGHHPPISVPSVLDIVVEFKTAVPSVGELLRQVNTYRAHRPADYYVVVTQGACPQRKLLRTECIQLVERMGDVCWNTAIVTPDACG
jgi:hypothetical protein